MATRICSSSVDGCARPLLQRRGFSATRQFSAFHSVPRENEQPLSSSTHPRLVKLESSAKAPQRWSSSIVTTSLIQAVALNNLMMIRRTTSSAELSKASPRKLTDLFSFPTATTMNASGRDLGDKPTISRALLTRKLSNQASL